MFELGCWATLASCGICRDSHRCKRNGTSFRRRSSICGHNVAWTWKGFASCFRQQSGRVQEKSFALTTRIVHDERIPEKAVQASRAVGDQIRTAPQTWAQRAYHNMRLCFRSSVQSFPCRKPPSVRYKNQKTVGDSNSVIITGLRGSFHGASFSRRDWKTSMAHIVQAVS